MTELQAQPQGNMPGIQLYGSRCNPYTFPITRIPRPLFLDNLHSRQGSTFTRDRFQAWASGNRQIDNTLIDNTLIDNTLIDNKQASNRIMSVKNTVSSIAPYAKPGKPFVAAAAFPDDIPRLVEVEFAAFQDEIVNHVLSYRDPTNPEHTARTIDFYKHCMQHIRTSTLPEHLFSRTHMRSDSKLDLALTDDKDDKTIEGYRFRKVIDPNTNEIIAFCKTEITTLTPQDHASPLDIGHETEPQMNRDWFALNERLHRQYCGLRQHLYFGMLATHPSHQHRGAATSLMSELIAEADALGLEIYCEATKTGKPMYEKYGFVPIYTLSFDPAEYGVTGLGVEVQTVMVRGALGKDGVRREVRKMEEIE